MGNDVNEIAADYGVHPLQMPPVEEGGLRRAATVLSSRRGPKQKEEEALKAALYQQIGQLKVELDWLKKKVGHVR